ncbi:MULTISPECIES: hypothetical protein [unclassified Paenibacillus]|nr:MULTISPECIES: hypothetical protein [unclassified Paenibacillus]MDK8183499.1 hypothetical protein [Paenibacillus sp. UMB4589-SE434]
MSKQHSENTPLAATVMSDKYGNKQVYFVGGGIASIAGISRL